jgi:pilus assembly protein FimV
MKRHIARCGTVTVGICLGVMFGVAQSGADVAGQSGREDAGGQVTVSGCLIEFSNAMSPAGATSENSRPSAGGQFVLANVRPASSSSPSADMPGGAGTSGTAGSGATPQSATGGASAPASAAPTLPNAAAASAARRYLVIGPQIDELRKHVMHQVEVSGTLEPRRPTVPESSSPSGGRTDTPSSGAGAAPAASGTSSSGATSGTGGVASSSGAASAPPATGTATPREGASRGAPDRSGALSNLPRLHASSIRMIAGACTPPGSPE